MEAGLKLEGIQIEAKCKTDGSRMKGLLEVSL